jgi:hypothetical protein
LPRLSMVVVPLCCTFLNKGSGVICFVHSCFAGLVVRLKVGRHRELRKASRFTVSPFALCFVLCLRIFRFRYTAQRVHIIKANKKPSAFGSGCGLKVMLFIPCGFVFWGLWYYSFLLF